MKSAYGINRCHGAFITAVKNAMLFLINYKFVYKDFEVSKSKRMKLSFFTALANAPYEFLIPYGMIVEMIIDSMIF